MATLGATAPTCCAVAYVSMQAQALTVVQSTSTQNQGRLELSRLTFALGGSYLSARRGESRAYGCTGLTPEGKFSATQLTSSPPPTSCGRQMLETARVPLGNKA